MNKSKISAAIVLTASLWGFNAQAAGYQLNEYSVTGLGRSFAGVGIVGDDYSALAYNPAGMTLKQGAGMQAGLTVAQIHSKVRDGDERTKMNFGVPLPNVFAQYQFNDRFFAGLGVYAPYGLKTRYKRNSFVAADGVESLLEIIDIAPAVAYKATDKLSLGASVIARYIHGKMTNTVPAIGQSGFSEFDLDGWTVAWSVGAMYEFSDRTRVGVSYKGKSMQTVKGDHTVSGADLPVLNQVVNNGEASPDLPQSILVSGYHQLNDKWGLSASVRWTDWEDSFEEFTLKSSALILQPTGGKNTTKEKWRSTWTISLGADYYLNENWTLRAGTAWDQSPVRNKYHRTTRIPDSNRIWLSLGASYRHGNMQVDAGFAHLFMQNSTAEHNIKAHYKSYSNMLGLQLQYKF